MTQLYSVFLYNQLVPDCGAVTRQQAWNKLKNKLADKYGERQRNARFLRQCGYDVRQTGAMAS